MPKTLTLKGVPDQVYQRLKAAAQALRRSLNGEAIVCLASALAHGRTAPDERLARVRALRATLPKARFDVREIDDMKREGRA